MIHKEYHEIFIINCNIKIDAKKFSKMRFISYSITCTSYY